MWLRSEENEVNDKGGDWGVGGGGVLSQVSAAPTGYVRCFSPFRLCEIPNRFVKILALNREWFAQKLDMYG